MKKDIKKSILETIDHFSEVETARDLLAGLVTPDPSDDFTGCNIYDHGIDAVLKDILEANLYELGEFKELDIIKAMKSKQIKTLVKTFKKALELI